MVNQPIANDQQNVFPDLLMPAEHDPVWERINTELINRRRTHQSPDGWASLGRALGMSVQAVTNWRHRGIPPRAHAAIASALGWSLDRLLGIGVIAPPSAPEPTAVGNGAECRSLLTVITLLSRHIMTMDEATREAVAPLLRRLANEPARVNQIARMLEALLTATHPGRRQRDMGPPGGISDRRHH